MIKPKDIDFGKVREIYWHDANYPDETQWLSKSDVQQSLADKLNRIKDNVCTCGAWTVNSLHDEDCKFIIIVKEFT